MWGRSERNEDSSTAERGEKERKGEKRREKERKGEKRREENRRDK